MKGERVRISDEGRAHNIHRMSDPERLGTIVGESRDKGCWQVVWDGTHTPSSIHKSYVQILEKTE